MAATRIKMDSRNNTMLVAILTFTFVLLCQKYVAEATECKLNGFDLSRLQSFNPWRSGHNKTDLTFDFHICDTPDHATACEGGIAVTAHNQTTNSSLSYGNCTLHNSTTETQDGVLLVMVKGEPCSLMPDELLTTVIYFKCGKKLGRPVYLGGFGCSVYFEWESFEFCTDLEHPANEIPCYLYNNSQLIDLSPLTKLKGGYLVNSENNRDFYINVCRDLSPDSPTGTGACPQNSSSCRLIDGEGASMGRPATKLTLSAGEIKMTYTATTKPHGCVDNPVTVVFFRCPERGGSKEPMLISDFMCQMDIEWFTEYACPQRTLTSDTCKLTMESHNVDLDLSPLTRLSGHPYAVNVTKEGDSYTYFLNVCGQLGINCGNTQSHHPAVCQVKGGHEQGKDLGDAHHMMLRYSDGELSLTYKDGETCHTNFARNTIINFQCQQNATNGGVGVPEYREEGECTYVFDWKTRYACIAHPADADCHVQHQGHIFDLSDLTVQQGSNWVALAEGDADNEYYVNVCHDVLHASGAEACPAGAAVCRKDKDGVSVGLGSYTSGLQYDPVEKKVFLNYTSPAVTGHDCPTPITTIITFVCKPGDLESAPALTHSSACLYQFEWHTAAACPLSHQQGHDCKVVDTQAGYNFDLSSLTKTSGSYKVTHDDFDYYINVCSKIGGEHCKDDNASVCQVKRGGTDEIKTGEPSQTLEYFNGVLNLTYTHGKPYHDAANTPRQTQLAFICDPAAGAGHPEYLTEDRHTYSFRWLTAYACPTRPIECVARGADGKQYDLSSLSKSVGGDNWAVLDDSDPADHRKFYINVCRSLAPVQGLTSSGGCQLNAAACITSLALNQESVTFANLGQAKTGPVVMAARDTYLRLVYTEGAACPDGGAGATYNTTIHFICVEGTQSRGPSPPRQVGPCSYEVIWDTSAACALTETDKGGSGSAGAAAGTPGACSISDGNYTYSLQSLRRDEGYTMQSPHKTRTFKLNICGAVSSCGDAGGDASACEVGTSGNAMLTRADTMALALTENSITVTYTGDRKASGMQTVVQVELACSREATEGNMTLVSMGVGGDNYLFHLDTPVSCPPRPVDCLVQDRAGRQYDLTTLAKVTLNYDVQDSRASHRDLHYLINVCRPINPLAGSTCPGGPIGGCQLGGRTSYGLGYVQSKPTVADDGTITLRYQGGDTCHKGTPQEARRSMRINFYCAKTESVPEFLGESANCEYSFTWSTPSACPLQRAEGADCNVTEPLYQYQFDLTPLRKTARDYTTGGGGHLYQVNVCGPLVQPPSGCEAMGACQTKPDHTTAIAAGQANAKLVYDAGELSLVYTGGKEGCHGKYRRTTVLTFLCDHSQDAAGSGPQFLQELEDCTYTLAWATALACPPHTVVDCSYTDPKTGNRYDLSSLALSDANYVKAYDDITYILNICHSLVHRKGETCPFNSAACMINATETDIKKKYQSVGEVTSSPVSMEDDKLVIRYNNGDPCPAGGKMTTLIILTCDQTPGAFEAGPSSHFVRNYCEHGFVWNTPAACPVDSQSSAKVGGSCKVTNPRTNYEFDLSKLRLGDDKMYVVNDRDGHHFNLNVCAAVGGTSCSNGTGSCQTELNTERSFSGGAANARLEYRDNGILTLNYSGGDVCHHNNVARTTIINFICHQGAGDGVPTYVDGSQGCVYYFDWHTDLVCEETVLCEVSADGTTFDLSPLIKDTGFHLALHDLPASSSASGGEDSQGSFYINVCRPLNPIFNTLCPAGSAACREVRGKPPQSLGRAMSPPSYNSATKEVTLTYDHGQACSSDPGKNASSRIIFRCKAGPEQGVPRLIDVTASCEYVFEWETNVVCKDDAKETETANCTYYDQRTLESFDLSPLKDLVEVDSPQGGKFSLQACGALPRSVSALCGGAAVCLAGSKGLGSASLQDGSYGTAASGTFQMDGEDLKLTFTGGHKCQSGDRTASTTILFRCDYEAGNGQPESLPHQQCQLSFLWRTSLVCPALVQDCAVSAGGATYDLSVLSQTRESWEFISVDGSRYWVNLCQRVHGEAHKQNCPPNSAVCRKTKTGQVDMLGDVKSQVISVKDDGTVVISYSHGTSACSHGRRRSNNPLARTVISLTCGPTVGVPMLNPSKQDNEECLFEFSWKTRAVCKADSLPVTLQDVNHVITDPRSGGSIDLRPLLQGGNRQAFDGKFQYIVSLEGHLSLDHGNPASAACQTAAVCQQDKDDAAHFKNLGAYASHQYFLNEAQLEARFTSPDKCTGKYSDKPVSSIIIFSCSSDTTGPTDPVFLYRTVDCTYLFTWDTPAACFKAKAEIATAGSAGEGGNTAAKGDKSASSGGINATTLATVISVFVTVLIVCLLAVYLHRPERRAAAAMRLKRIILCRKSTENEIRYSVLAQMDEDPEVSHVGGNPFEDDMENELQNGDAVGGKGFHDDSDDDMLL